MLSIRLICPNDGEKTDGTWSRRTGNLSSSTQAAQIKCATQWRRRYSFLFSGNLFELFQFARVLGFCGRRHSKGFLVVAQVCRF